MNNFLKLYLSTLVGFLAYCLTYMLSTIFTIMSIGYDNFLKNQASIRFRFIFISAAIFVLVFMFMYKLIGRKTLKKEDTV